MSNYVITKYTYDKAKFLNLDAKVSTSSPKNSTFI